MVVLVHGLGCTHRYFARLWPLLPGAQCPDLSGATVGELADELDRIAPPRPLLVANSLGCEVAVELAVRKPERVAGLVLIGPTVDARRRRFLPQLATLVLDALREDPRLLRLLVRDYAGWGLPRLLRTSRSMLRDRVEEKLPQVGAPAVVVRGARDPICPLDWAETVASLLPAGRLVVAPGAAHAVHWSHPGEVVRVVEELHQQLGEG
jgi:pimeloyl-ACP methyl ester carboxylesterase